MKKCPFPEWISELQKYAQILYSFTNHKDLLVILENNKEDENSLAVIDSNAIFSFCEQLESKWNIKNMGGSDNRTTDKEEIEEKEDVNNKLGNEASGVSLTAWVIIHVTNFLREIAYSKSFSSSSSVTSSSSSSSPSPSSYSINVIHHPIHNRRTIIQQLRYHLPLSPSPSPSPFASLSLHQQQLMQEVLLVNEYNSEIFLREFNRHLILQQLSTSSTSNDLQFSPLLTSHSLSKDGCLDQIPSNWIIVEWVYDKNMDYFGMARWSANDKFPLYFECPDQTRVQLSSLIQQYHELMNSNNSSFFVDESAKQNPDYIAQWWSVRKSLNQSFESWLHEFNTTIIEPYQYVFLPWKENDVFREAVYQLLDYCDSVVRDGQANTSSSTISNSVAVASTNGENNREERSEYQYWRTLFEGCLSCNNTPLSVQSFLRLCHAFPHCPFSSLNATAVYPLLQQYSRSLLSCSSSSSEVNVIFILSPSLQNLPFESCSWFHQHAIQLSRQFCLESLVISLQQLHQNCSYIPIDNGSYVINISSKQSFKRFQHD